MRKIHEEFNGDPGVDTSDSEELKAFLKHIVPNYDTERVYTSDNEKTGQPGTKFWSPTRRKTLTESVGRSRRTQNHRRPRKLPLGPAEPKRRRSPYERRLAWFFVIGRFVTRYFNPYVWPLFRYNPDLPFVRPDFPGNYLQNGQFYHAQYASSEVSMSRVLRWQLSP